MSDLNWDELAAVYDHFNSTQYNVVLPAFCAWIVERLDEREAADPERMVEIGCGTGLVSEMLANWYPKTEFLLNDHEPAMLRLAEPRLASLGERVQVEEADAADFLSALEDGSVDVVVLARSLYMLPEQEAFAAEVMRVLAPNGRVFVLDFLSGVDLEPLDAFFGEKEPEKWPLCRPIYEDFNEGIADGRYRLHTQESLLALWRGADGRPVTYQTNLPASNTHFMSITRRD